jgi:predicted nucleic-acid-binding protein
LKITADTNLLVRAIVGDDKKQAVLAQAELANAETIAIPIAVLCELAWVLSQRYKISQRMIANAIRALINGPTVVTANRAAEAGLAMLDAGGDFADGVIAYEGSWLGADCFVSFDQKAVKLLETQKVPARLISK